MSAEIKKIIIPSTGLGARFFPLSKVVAKELIPLADKPIIDYAVIEARDSGISQVIFVLPENKKIIYDYFRKNQKIESILKKQDVNLLKQREKEIKGMSFSFCIQTALKGDGDVILKAKNYVRKQPFAVLLPDNVIISKNPAINQLKRIFQTSNKPVIGLRRIPKDKASLHNTVAVEKIANHLYKIKKIKEKSSDLAIIGRYILTNEIFSYLKESKKKVSLSEALNLMLEDGKDIYGYEVDGNWLECNDKESWLKNNLYLSLHHSKYGPILREWLKENKI